MDIRIQNVSVCWKRFIEALSMETYIKSNQSGFLTQYMSKIFLKDEGVRSPKGILETPLSTYLDFMD